ncbi:hypothetical protein X801_09368, partial [Opisthorchis viverrini]
IALELITSSTVVQDSSVTNPVSDSCKHSDSGHSDVPHSLIPTSRPISPVLIRSDSPSLYVSCSVPDTDIDKSSCTRSQPSTVSHSPLASAHTPLGETIPPSGTPFPFPLVSEPQNFNSPSTDSSASVPSLLESRLTEGASDLSPDPIASTSSAVDVSSVSLSNGLYSTASLIASIVGRTNWSSSAVTTVSSVVLSSIPSNPVPSFTLRLASGGSIQGHTAVSGDCSLLVDTPMLSSHLSPTPPRSLTFAYCSTPSPSVTTSNSLLMSSTATTVPRVLIHKQTAFGHLGQGAPGASGLLDSYPLTLITAPTKCTAIEVGSTQTSSTSEHAIFQPSLASPKAKLVNLASPVSTNVRLLATSAAAKSHTITTSAASGGSLTPLQMTASPVKASVGIPGAVWSGLPSQPSSVNPTGIVALQSSQPLLVQTSHEVSTATQSTLTLNPVNSLRTSSVGPAINAHLSGTGPAVLAFSLTSTASTPVATSVAGTNLFAHASAIRQQVNACAPTAPLIIRSTVTPITPASLLKPINLSIAPGSQAFLTSVSGAPGTVTVTSTPVNIAPAKLATLQVSAATTSGSTCRAHPLSPISSPRHAAASIFSQSNRKRARKQQLASTFSAATTVTNSAPVTVCAPTVNVSGSTTVSSVPITQLPSTTNRIGFCNSSAVLAVTKPAIQPHVSHPPASVLLSPRPGGITGTGDPGVKVGCPINQSALSAINGVTPVVNTNSTGFVGIRLLSVRPSSLGGNTPCAPIPGSGFQSLTTTTPLTGGAIAPQLRSSSANTTEPHPLMIVTPSPTVSSASQIRISTAHTSSVSDLPQTVYVLTTTSYQAVSATSEPVASFPQRPVLGTSGPADTQVTATSTIPSSASFTTALMMPGGPTGGLLQVRFRPPISAASTPTFSPVTLDQSPSSRPASHSIPASLHLITASTTAGCVTSDVICKPGTPVDSTEVAPSKISPFRTLVPSSTGNSLLHRHLLSPQNPIHNDPVVDHSRVNGDTEDSENVSISCMTEFIASERPPPTTDFRGLTCSKQPKNQNVESQSRDRNVTSADRTKINTYKASDRLVHEVAAAEEVIHCEDSDGDNSESTLSHVAGKRVKVDESFRSDRSSAQIDSKTTVVADSIDPGRDERFLLTIDPSNGREWVLTGLPTRPSLIPRLSSSIRNGFPYRAKSTHFLSCSEIRCKPESKYNSFCGFRFSSSKSNQLEDNSSPVSVTRRRRRIAARQMPTEQSVTDTKVEGDSAPAVSQRRLMHDLTSVYLKQMELQFVHLPLTTSSVLSLTGWRIFNCANNLDLLVHSELHTMQSVETLSSKLENILSSSLPGSDVGTLSPLASSAQSNQSSNRNGATENWQHNCDAATTTLSVSSSATKNLDEQISKAVCQALELAKGISQRKKVLLKSIQRVQLLTKNVVEHFRPDALRFAETLNESQSTRSSSPFPIPTRPTATKSAPSPSPNRGVGLRRSVRNCSPLNVRRVRVREIGETVGTMVSEMADPEMAASSPGIKACSSAASNSSSRTSLCNGTSGGQIGRRSSNDWILYNKDDPPPSRSKNFQNSSKEADGGELHQLKSTLSQLSSQLELNPNSSDHEELLQLRDDLIQLIQLKEEQLLDDEKAALSALVHDLLQSSVIGDSTGSHVETCERPASAGSVTSDEESQWIGQRCSVPGWTSNGRFILQNAVVSGLVKEDGDSDQPATYARVFFAHPTRLSDAPCPQFVEHGTCHRGVRCRASHGKLVSI